jgi:hypothetical protein
MSEWEKGTEGELLGKNYHDGGACSLSETHADWEGRLFLREVDSISFTAISLNESSFSSSPLREVLVVARLKNVLCRSLLEEWLKKYKNKDTWDRVVPHGVMFKSGACWQKVEVLVDLSAPAVNVSRLSDGDIHSESASKIYLEMFNMGQKLAHMIAQEAPKRVIKKKDAERFRRCINQDGMTCTMRCTALLSAWTQSMVILITRITWPTMMPSLRSFRSQKRFTVRTPPSCTRQTMDPFTKCKNKEGIFAKRGSGRALKLCVVGCGGVCMVGACPNSSKSPFALSVTFATSFLPCVPRSTSLCTTTRGSLARWLLKRVDYEAEAFEWDPVEGSDVPVEGSESQDSKEEIAEGAYGGFDELFVLRKDFERCSLEFSK